jgi:AraC-like DNA-binding protein
MGGSEMDGAGICPPYEALKQLRMLREYQKAFHAATGLSLELVPARAVTNVCSRCVWRVARGQSPLLLPQAPVQKRTSPRVSPSGCRAGWAEVAVPVVINGKHAATLLVGNFLRHKPIRQNSGKALKLPGRGRNSPARVLRTKTGAADFQNPAISERRIRGAARLAMLFAQQFREWAERWPTDPHDGDPPFVVAAKRFIEQHIDTELTLAGVAQQVHLNAQYFCRQFRKATGLCFTEYVSRLRVQHARRLLADPSKRITEVAYASGFQSIPHFNRVFRKYAGTTPTASRISQRT